MIGVLTGFLMALGGCMATPTPSPSVPPPTPIESQPTIVPAVLAGRGFSSTAVTAAGAPFALVAGTRIRVRFDDEVHFGANAGCNGIGGRYRIERGRLITEDLSMTLIGCPRDRAEQDGWVWSILRSRPVIVLDGNILTLTAGDVVITLVEDEAEPT